MNTESQLRLQIVASIVVFSYQKAAWKKGICVVYITAGYTTTKATLLMSHQKAHRKLRSGAPAHFRHWNATITFTLNCQKRLTKAFNHFAFRLIAKKAGGISG